MLTDTSLTDAVMATLNLDPRIPESIEVAVGADDGMVTLRGTVESFSQRRAAARDARSVDGVYDVDNQLKVSLSGSDRRDDDEIRGAALQNLIWDVDVPSDLVDVKVDDGWVTLKGNVSYQFESDLERSRSRRRGSVRSWRAGLVLEGRRLASPAPRPVPDWKTRSSSFAPSRAHCSTCWPPSNATLHAEARPRRLGSERIRVHCHQTVPRHTFGCSVVDGLRTDGSRRSGFRSDHVVVARTTRLAEIEIHDGGGDLTWWLRATRSVFALAVAAESGDHFEHRVECGF